MKKLNNMVIVERKIVNGTQSKGRIDVNFATKRQCMPIERATKLQEEDELMTQENDSASLFKILGDAYQVNVKVGSKTVSRIVLLEEIEEAVKDFDKEQEAQKSLKKLIENDELKVKKTPGPKKKEKEPEV